MDRHRNVSRTSLTEFAPLSPETNEPGVGYQLLSKFFSFNKDESPPLGTTSTSGSPQSNTPIHTETMSSRRGSNESIQSTVSTGSAFPVNISEGRSLPNVLKRISNLLALKSNSLQAYKDTHLKQYWMPDSVSRECYDCEERFTTFRRRHHCRVCGQIFCSRCCNQEIPGKIMGCTGDLRVCTYCCKVVLGYLQSADMDAQLTADLRALQEDLQTKLGGGVAATPTPPLPVGGGTSVEAGPARRKLSAGFQEDNFALSRVPSDGLLRLEEEDGVRRPGSLRTLYQDLRRAGSGLPAQAHRYRLRTQRNCFLGSQLVDWLLAQARAANREQACAIGQALVDAGYLSPVGDRMFVDGFALYRPRDPPTTRTLTGADDDFAGIAGQEDPRTERRHPSTSSFDLDLDVGANTAHLSRAAAAASTPSTPSTPGTPQDSESQVGIPETSGLPNPERPIDPGRTADRERPANTSWHSTANLRTDNGELQAYQSLKEAFTAHEAALCRQLLNAEGLSQGWLDVVLPICHRLVDLVRPDVTNEPAEMDIRQYVQLKKVCGGTRSDSCVLSGAACTKNVAHRAMPARLRNPRILLLGCAIVYQRVEGRLTAIDRVVMQEREYLGHVAQRIAAVAPDVVLVERGVSRLAQDSLRAQGVALAVQVKPAALARIARLTGADIASSVDAHLSRIRLGTCRTFYTRAFPAHAGEGRKTLMFFEDCPAPERGCTVLLRGGTRSELARVKRVARLMLFARYNWRLEHSFLMDEFARPPTPPRGVFTEDNIQRLVGQEERPTGPLEKAQSPVPQSPQIPGSRDSPSLYASAAGSGFVLVDGADDSSQSEFNIEETVLKGAPVAVEKAKESAKAEAVSDRSDPLHSVGAEEPEGDVMAVSEPQAANRFRKALDDTILSVSPFLKWSEPFLETEAGRRCEIRRFFPTQVFRSAQLEDRPAPPRVEPAAPAAQDTEAAAVKLAAAKLGPQHELVWTKLTSRADAESVQATLADFRARGGRVLSSTNQWAAPEPSEGNRSRVTSAPNQGADPAASTEADVDALDPARHQTLAVLFSSHSLHSANAPAFCVSPWVVKMDFYGRNDIPLGGFLERYCFRESYACPSDTCDAPMLAHVRRFVHGTGCVHVSLRRLERPLDADPQQILVWSWCSRCRQSSSQPLSAESWALSLGKYLELRFHGGSYKLRGTVGLTCTHSLHHEHYQYFGFNDLIASFKYATITPWDVSLPPPLIELRYLAEQRASLVEDIKRLSMAGHDVYSAVLETLCALGTQLEGVAALKQLHKAEHAALKSCIEEVQLRLIAPSLRTLPKDGTPMDKEAVTALWALEDSVTHLKAHVALAVTRWNTRIQDAVGVRRKDKSPAQTSRLPETSSESGVDSDPGLSRPVVADEALLVSSPLPSDSPASDNSSPCGETAAAWDRAPDSQALPCPTELPSSEEEAVHETGTAKEPVVTKVPVEANEPDVVDPLETHELVSALEAVDIPEMAGPLESVSTQEPVADQETVSIREPTAVREQTVGTETLPVGCEGETEGKQSPAPPDRKSVKTIIMSQLRPAAPVFTPLQSPLPAAEHHLPTAGSLAPTPVLDNEPSSLIAHALASHEYRRALAELGATKAASATASPLSKRRSGPSPSGEKLDSASELTQSAESRKSTVLSFLRGSASAGSSPARSGTDEEPASPPLPSQPTASTAGETEPQSETRESRTRSGPGLHVEVALGGAGGVTLSCRVYFAEAFASLRRLVLPQGEEAFVRSLARCVTWAARGGRSGSAFCKTRDDRFVLKEMPRAELQVFLEFAPHYFGHVMRCHATSTPTLLGKIVGVFRVGLRNAATGTSSKATLLVMENLFYARAVTHKFDLKGSVRNRLVDPAEHGLGDVVLLDENLIKMACDSPLYMAAHSESVLSRAIENDTRFLSAQDVMDYSLLVGLDSERRQLVVGIIDYIRTFTWDKRLETMVKSSGILGGQGKMPTVVSPELYRARFIASMHQYFLPVPDRWAGLGKDVDWGRDEGKT